MKPSPPFVVRRCCPNCWRIWRVEAGELILVGRPYSTMLDAVRDVYRRWPWWP